MHAQAVVCVDASDLQSDTLSASLLAVMYAQAGPDSRENKD